MQRMTEKELNEWMPGDIEVVRNYIRALEAKLQAAEAALERIYGNDPHPHTIAESALRQLKEKSWTK